MTGGKVEGCSLERFEDATGLKLTDINGLRDDLPPITSFLNRLLALTIDLQNILFDGSDPGRWVLPVTVPPTKAALCCVSRRARALESADERGVNARFQRECAESCINRHRYNVTIRARRPKGASSSIAYEMLRSEAETTHSGEKRDCSFPLRAEFVGQGRPKLLLSKRLSPARLDRGHRHYKGRGPSRPIQSSA